MQKHLSAGNLVASILLLALLYSLTLAAAIAKAAKSKAESPALSVHTVLSEPNTELFTPLFLPQTGKLVLLKKLHEPDGHEAESYSEKELTEFQNRAQKDPRWADPKVVIVSTSGGSQDFIDVGWNPAANPQGTSIFYAHQQKPISGFRVLADPQKGNQIFSYDVKAKTKTELAAPTAGYLNSPVVSPDGSKLAFAICDAINGAWGGQVGIGVCDLKEASKHIVMPPQKHHGLFDLVGPMFWCGKDLIARRQVATAPGTYLADSYQISVVNATAGGKVIFDGKKPTQMSDIATDIEPTANDNILVLQSKSQITVTASGAILEKKALTKSPQGQERPNTSPSGQLTASGHERTLTIKNNKTGRKLSCKLPGKFTFCSWSPKDAPVQIAVVITTEKLKSMAPVFDSDVLLLVDIPDALQAGQGHR